MIRPLISILCGGVFSLACALPLSASAQLAGSVTTSSPSSQHVFAVEHGKYTLDGKPFQIIAGEMHYARIPREYWQARLKIAKAMGLNTITTYVFWNVHEQQPGKYDFSGQQDVAEFIREAQHEGLYVILRPGPYACAEWELGGYPAWLLKDKQTVVRSRDPRFMVPAKRWLARLGAELAPLQIGNGGPIIAVQVENEYGSFGDDHAYMEEIHQALVSAGFTKAMLYTADGPAQTPKGSLPELPTAINFGPGEAKKGFEKIKELRPQGPFMAGEYWDGWFDHWGEKHNVTDAPQQANEIAWILQQGYSINIYMVHGGTSFGWMNGANSDQGDYHPTVTSYDYDAALNENGQPTPKYYLFRDVIAKATGVVPAPVPTPPSTISIPEIGMTSSASIWRSLPPPIHSKDVLTMEDIDQAYGYILYRTAVHGPVSGDLHLEGLHDYARIYANGRFVGALDRRLKEDHLAINLSATDTQLDILVENSGRVNFNPVLRGERKGITGRVTLGGKLLQGWAIYSLPMNAPQNLTFGPNTCEGPCLYRANFKVDKVADTFLDTSEFTKGAVWVNGHALGRIWNVGPQETLYLPAPWLKQGDNQVVVLDLDGKPGHKLSGRTEPRYSGTTKLE